MAIAITTPQPGKFGWIINATSADASGCEELKAAPAAGLSIIVDHITINNGFDRPGCHGSEHVPAMGFSVRHCIDGGNVTNGRFVKQHRIVYFCMG